MKGSYILLIELPREINFPVGKLGIINFPKAFYAYVGSAMNGFKARLAHHLRNSRRPHWHIDYLLKEAKLLDIILCPSEQRMECFLAQALAEEFQSIPNFGASDCKCRSHLYFANDKEKLASKVVEAVEQASLAYKIFSQEEMKIDRV